MTMSLLSHNIRHIIWQRSYGKVIAAASNIQISWGRKSWKKVHQLATCTVQVIVQCTMHNNIGNTWNHGYFPVCELPVSNSINIIITYSWIQQFHIINFATFYTHSCINEHIDRCECIEHSSCSLICCYEQCMRAHFAYYRCFNKIYFEKKKMVQSLNVDEQKGRTISMATEKCCFRYIIKGEILILNFTKRRKPYFKYWIIQTHTHKCAQRIRCWNFCRLIIYWKVNLVEKYHTKNTLSYCTFVKFIRSHIAKSFTIRCVCIMPKCVAPFLPNNFQWNW